MDRRKISKLLGALLLIIIIGTESFKKWEGLETADALYLTITTISTVGNVAGPETNPGKLIGMLLIMSGLSVFSLVVIETTKAISDGHFRDIYRRGKMEQTIKNTSKHVIICGLGRMGKKVAEELQRSKKKFVIVEKKQEENLNLESTKNLYVLGDATVDETLLKAGVKKASGLIACLGSDSDNVFLTLAARNLSPKISIVARAFSKDAVARLSQAGANKVISPFELIGPWLARAVKNPAKHDFLEIITNSSSKNPIQELEVESNYLNKKTISESNIREKEKGIVLAVRRKGKTHLNPAPNFKFETGDKIFILKNN
tara:strand:+ start:209 stop:1156 length:948 start_codon:yes stop_codon:yes gene_type:complete